MALTTVNSSGIKDGEIVNADINASAAIAKSKLASLDIANADVNSNAAIAGSKISPDFGSQDIITTGHIDIPSSSMLKLGNTDSFEIFQQANNANAIIRTTGSSNLSLRTDGTQINLIDHTGISDVKMAEFNTGGSCSFKHGATTRLATTSTGASVTGNLDVSSGVDVTGAITGTTTISDSKGNVRSIPLNSQSSAYTLVAADAGKVVYISSGGVTINENVFSAGDAVTIINNSGSNQTLTEGSGNMALYNTADGTTGNRTLAGRGMCTLYWATASNAYISGSGLS